MAQTKQEKQETALHNIRCNIRRLVTQQEYFQENILKSYDNKCKEEMWLLLKFAGKENAKSKFKPQQTYKEVIDYIFDNESWIMYNPFIGDLVNMGFDWHTRIDDRNKLFHKIKELKVKHDYYLAESNKFLSSASLIFYGD